MKTPQSKTPRRKKAPGSTGRKKALAPAIALPRDADVAQVRLGERTVQLTNLRKRFWDKAGITKGDLLQYYLDVAPVLLPHVKDRAMVMKRYPHGAAGDVLLHEARALAAAAVDRDVRHRARAPAA